MHATTQQLLSLRDKELVSVDVQQHVSQCQTCQRALAELQSVQHSLRAIGEKTVNEYSGIVPEWETIQQKVQERKQLLSRRRRWSQWGIAASILAVALTSFSFFNLESDTTTSQQNVANTNRTSTIGTSEPEIGVTNNSPDLHALLLQRNSTLEQAIRELPKTSRVVSGGTAYTIANLEDQIALLDYQLTHSDQIGINETQSVELLQNRASLLNSLYKVRYGDAMLRLASY